MNTNGMDCMMYHLQEEGGTKSPARGDVSDLGEYKHVLWMFTLRRASTPFPGKFPHMKHKSPHAQPDRATLT